MATRTKRLCISSSERTYSVLKLLSEHYGTSMTGAFQKAVAFLEWITTARAEGWTIVVEKDGERREVVLW